MNSARTNLPKFSLTLVYLRTTRSLSKQCFEVLVMLRNQSLRPGNKGHGLRNFGKTYELRIRLHGPKRQGFLTLSTVRIISYPVPGTVQVSSLSAFPEIRRSKVENRKSFPKSSRSKVVRISAQ